MLFCNLKFVVIYAFSAKSVFTKFQSSQKKFLPSVVTGHQIDKEMCFSKKIYKPPIFLNG